MELRYIYRGLGVGLLGGLLAFVVARILAEPYIQDAIDYEAGRHAAQEALTSAAHSGGHDEAEIFSRSVQSTPGLAVGLAGFGLAMGGLFVVAYLIATRLYPDLRPRVLAGLLGAAGFVALYLVPFAKYPGNPPAVGNEETIGDRSALYLAMIGISVVALALAVVAGRWLAARVGGWNASLLGAVIFLVLVGIAMVLLPDYGELAANKAEFGNATTETPQALTGPDGQIVFPGFPADLLFRFRFYAVLGQLVIWSTIALAFGALAERLAATPARVPRPAPADHATTGEPAATTAS